HAEIAQDLAADAVVAHVGLEAELLVRGDRVEALLLQLVSSQLVEEADAAALLQEVEEHAAPFLRDGLERERELRAAVAARGAEDVAGEARGMDAHEHRLVLVDLARDERDVLLVRHLGAETDDAELPELRREVRRGDAVHEPLRAHAVPDDV